MFQLSRAQLIAFATVGVISAGGLGSPAGAQEPLTRTGPVGPYEPILASVGSKRLIAFFVPDNGRCAVNTVVWDSGAAEAPYSSARMRISLNPGQAFARWRQARDGQYPMRRQCRDPQRRRPSLDPDRRHVF